MSKEDCSSKQHITPKSNKNNRAINKNVKAMQCLLNICKVLSVQSIGQMLAMMNILPWMIASNI